MKRTLSLVMAIAMVIGLLPAVSLAASAAEPHSFVYDFSTAALTSSISFFVLPAT